METSARRHQKRLAQISIQLLVALMVSITGVMEPAHPGFWWAILMATIVGGLLAFPMNYWLVAKHLKHGMGTVRAVGRGGHSMEQESELATRVPVAGILYPFMGILLSPIFAAAAMSFSSVSVVSNALRLRTTKL